MTVGIVGLGLIGGSFAKAYHAAGWTVYGYDVDESMLAFAQLADAVNAPLTMENIGTCDLVLLCVRPLAAIDYLRSAAPHIGSRPVVIDCCGTKARGLRGGVPAGGAVPVYLSRRTSDGRYAVFRVRPCACESVSQCADGHCAAGF